MLQLEGELARSPQARRQPAQELLAGFLEERAPVAWFTPEDFAIVRQLQRHRPALAPLPLLLQLQQAFRLGLLPATLNPLLVRAAAALGYPVEEPGFTSSAWGAASSKPSWR